VPYLLFVGLLTFSCAREKIRSRIKSWIKRTVKLRLKLLKHLFLLFDKKIKASIWGSWDSLRLWSDFDPDERSRWAHFILVPIDKKTLNWYQRSSRTGEIRSISLQKIEKSRFLCMLSFALSDRRKTLGLARIFVEMNWFPWLARIWPFRKTNLSPERYRMEMATQIQSQLMVEELSMTSNRRSCAVNDGWKMLYM